ncbi:hypothetical protein BU16DRAFT_26926 [Lophium mytilinum]|uniref:Uncharacterized protein n=1 Tax=Lophium mytilinum TaxID=390894 RepID=A0A6A6RHT8_9PEZI|nr:hypothetical protein BU16DRAFT_26926 [Lophium mytilinum]
MADASSPPTREEPSSTPHRVYNKPAWYAVPGKIFLGFLTAPYRRTFKLYTWKPLKEIRAADGDRKAVCRLVADWREDKYQELQSVQVAASFCAGASLATLSWNQEQSPHWAASALWYTSLSCSIWGIITSIQQKSILDDLPDKDVLNDASIPEYDLKRTRRVILRYKKRPGIGHWLMLFFWQFPSMQMSYAWCTFLAGLTVYICTPFIRRQAWGDDSKIAIVYLVVAGVGLVTFLLSSCFVYSSEKACEQSVVNSRSNTNEAGIGSFKSPFDNTHPSAADSVTNGQSTTNVSLSQTLRTRGLLIDSSRKGPQSGRQFPSSSSSKKEALLM